MVYSTTFSLSRTLAETVFIICVITQGHCLEREAYFTAQNTCPGTVIQEDNCPKTTTTTRRAECAAHCARDDACVSFLLDSNSGLCHLCNTTPSRDCSDTIPNFGVEVFELKCLNGGHRENGQCQCPHAYSGDFCQTVMTDCMDWYDAGLGDLDEEAVHWVLPPLSPQAFPAMCQFMKKARLLILKRTQPALDFYRNWTQYADGFGDVAGDHWLGLHKLHQLTSSRCYKLVVQLRLLNGTYLQQFYRNFVVADESQQFAVNFAATYFSRIHRLGDCLSDVRGKPFSTYDADHDDDATGSCAKRHHSGWWFGNCTLCNPTGILTQPSDMQRTGDPAEVFWTPGLGHLAPQTVEMVLSKC